MEQHGDETSHSSIPSEVLDVANASRRDLLRAALFGTPPGERRVGRFVIHGVLGRGGMGTVLEGFDEVLDRPVAIKVLHPSLARHETRLLEEARALARLSHPNVVQVYEAGKTDGRIYIVMELLRGQTLRDWQQLRPPWRGCVDAYVQAGQGLAAAHALGLVHRDFKPSNCIRDEHGHVHVLDFGLVRRAGDLQARESKPRERVEATVADGSTQPGARMGTPAYMAPEQLLGGLADARSDQYGFCVALYEALLGHHPFGEGDPDTRREAMLRGALQLQRGDAHLPVWVRRALVRGLAVDPAARWPDMAALLRVLDPAQRTERRAWRVAILAGLVGAGALSYAWASRPTPCTAPAARLEQEWSESRREAVRAGLVQSGSPLAEATWARFEPQVSAYLQGWGKVHRDVCEATYVRGEQSEMLLDHRMACLDLRLDAVASLLGALEHADTDVVLHAMTAALRLPDPAPCRSQTKDDTPLEPSTQARLQQRLVRLVTEIDLGRGDVAEPLATLREEAKANGLDRIAAQALYWSGLVALQRGEIDAADATLEAAVWECLAARDDETALRAMLEHVGLVGGLRLDSVRSIPRLPWARALLERQGEPTALRVRYLIVAADVLGRNGHHTDARPLIDEALALVPTLPEPRRLYEEALNTAGVVAQLSGRSAEAEAIFERALEHTRVTYGDRHTKVALRLNNLAVAEANNGDRRGAREHLVEALAIEREVLGSRHLSVGDALMNLAGVQHRDRPDDALAAVDEARAIYAAALGEAATKTLAADLARGHIAAQLGRVDEAERIYRQVLDQQRRALGERHAECAPTLRALAKLLATTDRRAQAHELSTLADAIEREAADTDTDASP
ncbi:MAG: serine/threonine-protein kinase [Nannocystaceae bacterium]